MSSTNESSAWSPFRHAAFAVLWSATVVSSIGTWMNDVGAGWLMTELSPSPTIVAAVQAATTAPAFLFALLAGALADTMDRRKLLLIVNAGLAAAAVLLAVLVALDAMTPWLLLLFTFVFGTGAALMGPAWQAIVPKLVPREDLRPAIALNSMGINISRAIGPALGGVLIVSLGLAAPFAANALSFVAILLALWWWTPSAETQSNLPPEQVGSAIVAGLRYALASPPLRQTLVRAAAFFVFASAYWAMLPLIARQVLDGGPTLYGVLLGAVGAGAVAGALVLPRVRKRLGADRTVAAGTIGTGLAMAVFGAVQIEAAAVGASLLAGCSWIAVLASLNVSAQIALPDWVRARGLSVFLTVFAGSMAAGSLFWGQVASHLSIGSALMIASAGAVAVLPLVRRFRLDAGAGIDHTPSMHWPEPVIAESHGTDRGPVMMVVTYRIEPRDEAEFVTLLYRLRDSRRRGGGYGWSLGVDASEPGRFVETWYETSWVQHLRHHERISEADRMLQARIRELDRGDTPPTASHFIAVPAPKPGPGES